MPTKSQTPTQLDAVPEPVRLKNGELAESGENYLETILVMRSRNPHSRVRAVDVANELGFSKPSVSRAINLLKERGLIKIGQGGSLEFTPEGQAKAENIFGRHQVLTVLFQEIAGVPYDVAERDACRIEHVISDETIMGIRSFLGERLKLSDPQTAQGKTSEGDSAAGTKVQQDKVLDWAKDGEEPKPAEDGRPGEGDLWAAERWSEQHKNGHGVHQEAEGV